MQSLRRLMQFLFRGNGQTSVVPPGTTTMENDFGVGRSSGTEEGSEKQPGAQEPDGAQGITVELGTPQQSGRDLPIHTSATLSRPVTRSMTRPQRGSHTVDGPKTDLMSKLLDASSRTVERSTASRLEDAKDIDYIDIQDQDEEAGNYPDTGSTKSRKRKLRATTEHRDASQVGAPVRSSITAKPAASPVRSKSSRPSKRQKTQTGCGPRMPLRRSARLAKPLTEFHKYRMLMPELQIMVFEAALAPRLVYIQNRSGASFSVQQSSPSWFMTNSISVAVAKASYKKMFRQDVDPSMDIVALEPCCGGCRGYHCANRNFSEEDRKAVRLLAVQMEPRWLESLPYLISPVWATIDMAWPKVETLYLMKRGLMGDVSEEQAVIRCREGPREADLRSRFEQWKKTAGAKKTMTRLEFVVVVPKESSSKSLLERYQDVQERATGGPEDIILG